MRYNVAAAVLALAGAAVLCVAQDADRGAAGWRPAVDAPGLPKTPIVNPDLHVRLAAQFVATAADFDDKDGKPVRGHGSFQKADYPYVGFLSYWNVPDDKLNSFVLFTNVWLQQMSFQPHLSPLKEVPGSRGRLFWVDVRDYGWNQGAWRAVAERDQYIAEPWVDHRHAEYLRRVLCKPLSQAALKGREIAEGAGRVRTELILPAGTVVTATQFLRDTLETDRTSSYYDLLFAKYRFTASDEEEERVERVPYVERVNYHHKGGPFTDPNGKYHPDLEAGYYYCDVTKYRERRFTVKVDGWKFRDFPKDTREWEEAFGIDKIRGLMRERKIDLDFGAVVEGGLDNPKTGSAVALHNRLIVTVVGPFGAAMETFDVKDPGGVKDFTESTIFKGERFEPGSGARAVSDGGELLAYLPNGGQAGFLRNGQGKRAEFAPNELAADADPGLDKRVRNVGSCFTCHAPSGGYIVPRDLIGEGHKEGVKAKFYDREQELRFLGFFKSREKQIKGFQDPYLDLIEQCTQPAPAAKLGGEVGQLVGGGHGLMGLIGRAAPVEAKGWTGARFAAELLAFRKWYDEPITLDLAAAEVGVPADVLRGLLVRSPFYRGQQLAKGRPVPRRVWERDLFANVQILRAAEVATYERRGRP